jgi:hypothetical protein
MGGQLQNSQERQEKQPGGNNPTKVPLLEELKNFNCLLAVEENFDEEFSDGDEDWVGFYTV